MNKNLLKSILLIITYTVFLVLALLKFDVLWGFLSQALAAMRPFYLGFAIAFVLTRPCLFFDRLYQRVLPKKSADRLSRPLAVTTAYLALILAIALLFALKYPEYVEKLVLNGADLSPSGVKLSIQAPIVLGWGLLQVIRRLDKRAQPKWELLDLMATQPHIRPEALSALSMPALVVAGERDMIREKHTRLIAKSIPGSKLAILPGDHFLARRNWQAFNPVVLDFLSE